MVGLILCQHRGCTVLWWSSVSKLDARRATGNPYLTARLRIPRSIFTVQLVHAGGRMDPRWPLQPPLHPAGFPPARF
jgi:hypothetical protein